MNTAEMSALARSVERLGATVSERFATFEQRLGAVDKRIGDIVIPAKSRGASIMPMQEVLRTSTASPNPLPASPGGISEDAAREHASLAKFLRTGDDSAFAAISAGGFGSDFSASMMVGSDPDGGFTVVPVLSAAIQSKVFDQSPLGRLARQVTIDTGDAFEEPIDADDIAAEWVDEEEDRPELDTSKLKYLHVPVNEIYTNQPVTQRLLDDSRFDIGGWLEGKISDKFARAEGAAYVNGDGLRKPLGLLARPTSSDADGMRDFFTIQHINTGVGGGFVAVSAGASPADVLIDTVYALRAPYRPNARWLMNRNTAGTVRKFKDAEGRFIWQESISQGEPPMLLGFPVELDEEMPDIDANSLSIAFGDFQQAYIVVRKPGLRMLRDPYTAKPHVLFYAYARVGGQVQNGEAVKLIRFAANG